MQLPSALWHRPTSLVLLVWYLLLPHYDVDGKVLDKAPLSAWKIHDRYNSLAACEAVREQMLKDAREVLSEEERRAELSDAAQVAVLTAARCVASNDL